MKLIRKTIFTIKMNFPTCNAPHMTEKSSTALIATVYEGICAKDHEGTAGLVTRLGIRPKKQKNIRVPSVYRLLSVIPYDIMYKRTDKALRYTAIDAINHGRVEKDDVNKTKMESDDDSLKLTHLIKFKRRDTTRPRYTSQQEP